jgi:hypothetical protein
MCAVAARTFRMLLSSPMEELRKIRSLPPEDRSLLWQTAFLIVTLRIALHLLPFWRVNEYLGRRASRSSIQRVAPSRVVWAVRVAAAHIPGSTCLTQALAAKYQLGRSGCNAQLRVGVTIENGTFLSHAWLEYEGESILGGEIASRYQPLFALD